MVNHFGTGVQSIFSDHNLSFLIVKNYAPPPSFYIHLSSIDIICITFFGGNSHLIEENLKNVLGKIRFIIF